jgi:UDP-glucuronate 4-epimerase
MKILVTGSAGFIGAALTVRLLARGDTVSGVDNHNNYYDQALKEARLEQFLSHPKYRHHRTDIANGPELATIFKTEEPDRVVNLAAQAGVRYSIENPSAYIDSNIVGFTNILEGCRQNNVEHLVFASSSSVYGANTSLPYSAHQNVDHPLSLYAATKKSNELMAHSYSHLYRIPTTGLRFFTVYGPWGRPDMALFKFAQAIIEGSPIKLFNHGNHRRDFTYVDDIVEGIIRVLDHPATPEENWNSANPDPATSNAPYRIYNIGNSHPVELIDYISALEQALGKVAKKEYLPLQPGDVPNTHADIRELQQEFNYSPQIDVTTGVKQFAIWYQKYYSNILRNK